MVHSLSRNSRRGNAIPTFARRQIFVALFLLSTLFTILLIFKSSTIAVVRDPEYVDHRDIEYLPVFHATKQDTPKEGTKIVPDRRFGQPSTTTKQQAMNYYNPPSQTGISVCFITAQFSSSRQRTDHLYDAGKTTPRLYESPLYHFFAFTNLADLEAPGWEVVVQDLREYNRWITQSRWAKFLAFRHEIIREKCQVVFYIDGILSPKDDIELFQAESRRILDSPIQLAQRLHPYGGGAEAEMERIILKRKDVKKNVDASLQWLRAQGDYDKNCTLYENSMFGYAIDSVAFKKAAYFFWHHYSKEEDSWRDQPLWCYTLDHFDITPMQLTGNGKDILFNQVNSRTAKGSHKYKSESVVSAKSYYDSLNRMVSIADSCWLDTSATAFNSSLKPAVITHDFLTPICPDMYRRSMVPEKRTNPGLTISLPYFSQPALLLQQLQNFASYPKDIQKKLSIVIVDDGSPSGLRAIDHLNLTNNINTASHYFNINTTSSPIPYYFMLRIVRINHNIDWNAEGSHNLAFFLANTRLGLILDLRMIVPIETISDVLIWDTTKNNSETKKNLSIAHKFNRRRQNGKTEHQQTCALIDIQEYWNSGGMDEDFAGNYGYGTSDHFWHKWERSGRAIQKHDTSFLLEQDTEACESSWLYSSKKIKECKAARSQQNDPTKERKTNNALLKKKISNRIGWQNAYLRFNWTIDF